MSTHMMKESMHEDSVQSEFEVSTHDQKVSTHEDSVKRVEGVDT